MFVFWPHRNVLILTIVVVATQSPRHSKRQPLKISTALPLQPYHAPPSGMSGSYSSYSRHPTRRSHRPRPPVSSLTYSRHPTAAQSIAVQYRYRLGQETRRERTVRQSPVSPISATATLCSSEHSGFMARMEPRPRMTYSCIVALDHAVSLLHCLTSCWYPQCICQSREAYAMMLRGHDIRNIMCTRPGCGKVLSDLRALTTHIHIHNLDAMD